MAPSPRFPNRLSLNESAFGPSPLARRAINDALDDLGRYAGDDLAQLRKTIAELDGVAPDQIVFGEVLNIFGLYLAASGGSQNEFIHSVPGYTALVDAVAPAGGKVIAIPLDATLKNDLDAIAQRIDDRTRAVYLVNPHNPTGLVEEKHQFLAAVRELSTRTLVLVDEAYLDFLPDYAERTAARLLRDGARVVVFRTFAKLHGLAGLAFGYALAPPDVAAAMTQMGVGAFFTTNRLSLVAAEASLRDPGFVATVRSSVAAEREAWHRLFRNHNVRFTEASANFVFFDAGRPHQQIAAAFAAAGLDIGRAHPPLNTWVRVSIGLQDDNALARQVFETVVGQN